MPATVFVTAHNHYAVQAFEVQALDYLTKPVEPQRLQSTLRRIHERIAHHAAFQTHEQLKAALALLRPENLGRVSPPKPRDALSWACG